MSRPPEPPRPSRPPGPPRPRRVVWLGGLLAGLGVLVALIVLALTSSGPRPRRRPPLSRPPLAARPAPRGTVYGAAVNDLFNDGTLAAGTVPAALAALRATGAGIARADALWEASEPTAPVGGRRVWDWRFDDGLAAALARSGLAWLPILDYSAPWAQSIPGEDHSPPASDAGYAAYAAAFAARFGANGTFWAAHPGLPRRPVTTIEIWNEPDNPQFWVPQPDPAAYGTLYAAARQAIDAVDPSARVIVGGLTRPTTFLPAMLHADPELAGRIDGVAIHPYGPPDRVLARVRAARATLRAIGQGQVPLYVTEFGWTTSPPGAVAYAAAGRRPGYLRTTLAALRRAAPGCGLAAVIVYAWATPQATPGNPNDWYGIHGPGDAATQAAFATGLRAQARRRPAAEPAALSGCSS